ncbi:hypothetical protein Psi01_85050 [Planobispora siamensis]|uniref:Uncharacterized protein n=1 Tax=Planobispora siamensis TaxID=936338 RepID=A0A8J3SQY9_9ACTN|nr:hypothetical protein Psi01_85050 [Planobispora siamensis]
MNDGCCPTCMAVWALVARARAESAKELAHTASLMAAKAAMRGVELQERRERLAERAAHFEARRQQSQQWTDGQAR